MGLAGDQRPARGLISAFRLGVAGDVNGDGFADVVVGAPGYAYEPASLGSAFVYYGSKDGLSETESWRAEFCQTQALFGSR